MVDYALAVRPGEGKAEKAVVMQFNCRESDLIADEEDLEIIADASAISKDDKTIEVDNTLPASPYTDSGRAYLLEGCVRKPVETSVDFDQRLELGTSVRTTVATGMKDTSSRSHCIFTVYIEMQSSVTGESRNSKVPQVDLADSARVAKPGIALGQESISIKTSRSTLNRSFAR